MESIDVAASNGIKTVITHVSSGWNAPQANDFDEHLLPFGGTYHYEQMMRKLDEYGYSGSLMLEVSDRIRFTVVSPFRFWI